MRRAAFVSLRRAAFVSHVTYVRLEVVELWGKGRWNFCFGKLRTGD